jgi:aconitase A
LRPVTSSGISRRNVVPARHAIHRDPAAVRLDDAPRQRETQPDAARPARAAPAVIAKSFERIHRSNLVMMGILLPCQFEEATDAASLRLISNETSDVPGVSGALAPRMKARLAIHRADGKQDEVPVIVRIDTPIEVEYYKGGGILPYVLRQTLSRT